jgi:hypothetical protein
MAPIGASLYATHPLYATMRIEIITGSFSSIGMVIKTGGWPLAISHPATVVKFILSSLRPDNRRIANLTRAVMIYSMLAALEPELTHCITTHMVHQKFH